MYPHTSYSQDEYDAIDWAIEQVEAYVKKFNIMQYNRPYNTMEAVVQLIVKDIIVWCAPTSQNMNTLMKWNMISGDDYSVWEELVAQYVVDHFDKLPPRKTSFEVRVVRRSDFGTSILFSQEFEHHKDAEEFYMENKYKLGRMYPNLTDIRIVIKHEKNHVTPYPLVVIVGYGGSHMSNHLNQSIMTHETRKIVCGSRNLDGKLSTSMPEGFDLGSIIKDDFFDNNCSYNGADRFVGYIDLDGFNGTICEAIIENKADFLLHIIGYNYLPEEEFDSLIGHLVDAFSDYDVTIDLRFERDYDGSVRPGPMNATVYARKETELSPMVKQFYELKAKHPDAVLLFRCGDFYETYSDDAEEASRILGITLTKSSKTKDKDDKPLAMAGFPHHALDTYLPKLIRAGKRVAICDDLEKFFGK